MENFMEIFTCVLELGIDYFFLNGVLGVKVNSKLRVCVCFICALMFNIFRSYVSIPFVPNIVVTAVLSLLLAFICFNGKPMKKMFFVAVLIILIIVCDMLTALALSLIFGEDYAGIGYSMRFVGMIMTNMIFFALSLYTVYLARRQYRKLPLKFNILMILCPVISFLILLLIDRCIALSQTPDFLYVLSVIAVLGLGYINIMIFNFFDYYEKASRVIETETILKLNDENYKLLESNERELHIMRHDILKHKTQIQEMLKAGDNEFVRKYYNDLNQIISNITSFSRTGDLTLDTVLNIEGKKAVSLGVKYDLKLKVEAPIHISSIDLTKIMRNALDNAIEACAGMDDKYVLVTVNVDIDKFFTKIENSSPNVNIKDNNISSRKVGGLHGYGLKSMKDSVEKYNGTMNLSYRNDVFICQIVLNNREQTEI